MQVQHHKHRFEIVKLTLLNSKGCFQISSCRSHPILHIISTCDVPIIDLLANLGKNLNRTLL